MIELKQAPGSFNRPAELRSKSYLDSSLRDFENSQIISSLLGPSFVIDLVADYEQEMESRVKSNLTDY